MEYAGLALAVLSSLQEVYLLSKVVIRIVSSAVHHDDEQSKMMLEFRHEFLIIKSFGHLLTKIDGSVVDEDALDVLWLKHVLQILEQLRAAYNDYAKLAAEQDIEYQQHSPFTRSVVSRSRRIEFNLDIDEDEERAVSRQWVVKLAKLKTRDWRWALFQKKRLEAVLKTFQLWNGKLKELVPIILAGGHSSLTYKRISDLGISTASPENSTRLGLMTHEELRELTSSTDTASSDELALENVVLSVSSANTLSPFHLGTMSRANRIVGTVLVEYKALVETQQSATGNAGAVSQKESEVGDFPADGGEVSENISAGAEVVKLAKLLKVAGSSHMRTLPFLGYVDSSTENPPRYAFVFDFPNQALETAPISLHDIVATTVRPGLTLTDRFKIAQKISKSIWLLHNDEWVHKSIQSRSVLFFAGEGGITLYEYPYLTNFEYSRPVNEMTIWTYDNDEEKNLYRHPDRQGPPLRSFDKLHDIYALGVILLEIGLWKTAASIRDEAANKADRLHESFSTYDLRAAYVDAAKSSLPHHMGIGYRNAVLACLLGDFVARVYEPRFAMEFFQNVVLNLELNMLHKAGENPDD